jgi:ABC-type multidrug transport system fused ATPase/permease subunit
LVIDVFSLATFSSTFSLISVIAESISLVTAAISCSGDFSDFLSSTLATVGVGFFDFGSALATIFLMSFSVAVIAWLISSLFALNETAVGQCFKELFKGKKQGTEKILFMGMDAEKTAKLLEDEMLSVERDGRKQGKEAVKLLLEAFDTEENDRIRGKRVMIPYKVTGV